MRSIVAALCVALTLADQHDPVLQVNDGNLELKLGRRESHVVIQASKTVTADDIVKHVDSLENEALPELTAGVNNDNNMLAYQAAMDQRIASFAGYMSNKQRIDTASALLKEVETEIDTIDNGVDDLTTSFEADAKNLTDSITGRFARASKETINQLDAASDKMADDIKKAKDAAAKVADETFYIHYGSKTCKRLASSNKLKKITKRFEGWHYATQHNNRGGGSMPLCLIDEGGSQGGFRTGGWNDGVRPVRIEHTGNTEGELRGVNSRIIPCSACTYPGKCYAEWGVEGCKMEGYSPAYTGFGFAGYHNHWGNNGRICVDRNINRGEWNNGGYYVAHIYPTVTVDGTMKRSGGTYVQACSMCCRDE